MIKTVIATFKEVGFHCWPNAPAEVSYLCNTHRHEFLIRVEARVGHDNREIEFHMLKREAKLAMITAFDAAEHGGEFQFGHRSCEMIAQHLYASMRYPVSAIEVWEDQENGARVEFV